jgi:peptide/nickel transport system substrate-binding protein
MGRSLTRFTLVAALAASVGLAACGSSNDNKSSSKSSSGGGKYNAAAPVSGQKKGGTIKFLSTESFEHLDPGTAYFQLDFMVAFAAHRPLFYYKPENSTKPIPDLAEGAPEVSADGKTVTVKIKKGIKYGTVKKTPIDGQEVKSADIKYSLERGLNPHVANGYEGVYFPIVGSDKSKGGPLSGIDTPDDYTVVFHLTKNFGATMAKALVMALTMPVPKSYAAQFDKKNPSTYDTDPTVQAFTGPYMISKYSAGKNLELIRNPNWDAGTDSRPAYLDKVDWRMGSDPNVSGRQIFNGSGMANGDTPAAPIIKQFATRRPKDISFTPLGNRFVGLNYKKKPFSDINARKAAAAILDRVAMQRVRGGPIVGDIATHLLPPSLPGFAEAGGAAGPGYDFLKNPSGDLAVAQAYMKKAGYASGKANGEKIVMFGDNASPAKENAQIVQNSLEKLGFKVEPHLVEHSVFYSKYCNVVSQLKKIDVCANYGWLPDFADPYAMLNANFNGESIVPVNNSNPSLFDAPAINKQMDKASEVTDEAQRSQAWGAVDKALTENVAGIPWFWDKTANIQSDNVQGVIAQWNAAWDLSYMSLK